MSQIKQASILNYIRVFAMLGIIGDHYLQSTGIPTLSNTGLWMGGVFLMMFFALSAYLFGMKWVKGGCVAFGTWNFLKKRCVRIYLPLWIILPIVILTEWLQGSNLNTETVLMNLLGLGWVRPFTMGGHLWYITLMMFLYVVFIVFSHIRLDRCRLVYWFAGFIILASVYIVGEKYFQSFSVVAPVITVFFTGMLFFKGEVLIERCRQWPFALIIVTVVLLVLSWWMYIQGWHDTHKAIATIFSFSAGFALFISMLSLIGAESDNRAVNKLASISYEVYLVHLPLLPLSGYLIRLTGVDYRWMIVVLWLVLTYVTANATHALTGLIAKK